MQTCLQAFLDSPTGAETLRCRIFPTRSPHPAEEFSLSEPSSDVQLMGLPPLETHTTLRAPLIWTYGRMNPGSFSLPGCFHIPMMGFPPLGRQLHDGISPTREDTSADGLLPCWRYWIIVGQEPPIRDRCIQSVDGLDPHFRPIFCKSDRTMATYGTRYIYEDFLI